MIRRSSLWIGSVLLLTSLTAYAGGPPILTTSKVPEYFIVGRAEILVFVVRSFCCHHELLDHRDSFRVRATAPGQRKIEIPATPTANPGEYTATLTLPASGDWAITVDFYNCCNDRQSPHYTEEPSCPAASCQRSFLWRREESAISSRRVASRVTSTERLSHRHLIRGDLDRNSNRSC